MKQEVVTVKPKWLKTLEELKGSCKPKRKMSKAERAKMMEDMTEEESEAILRKYGFKETQEEQSQ